MTVKIRNIVFFMLIHINFAHSQKVTLYPPGDYFVDSLELTKLCQPTYVFEYYALDSKKSVENSSTSKNMKSTAQILNEWNGAFKKPENFNQTGFLTIRFIVNCRLEPCCFKLYEMDKNYQPMAFDDAVKTQLMAFVKKLNG